MEKQSNSILNPKVIPILLAFMCMGFGDAAGPLAGVIKEDLGLTSNFMVQLLPFMGYIMFGLLSIPLGIVQDKKGKKYILMLGIVVAFVGLLLPTLGLFPVDIKSLGQDQIFQYYLLILLSILLLGLANTILQVAGNPIMRDVSEEGRYSRNLSIGQFVKAIGTLSATLIPLAAVRWFGMDWTLIFPVYSVIILIALLFIWPMKVKEKDEDKEEPSSFRSCMGLLKNPFVLFMVLGIFLYVGTEIAMRSHLPIYLKNQFGIQIKEVGLAGVLFFDLALLAGRLLGGVILHWIKPRIFFRVTSFLSIIGVLGLFLSSSGMGIDSSSLGFVSALVIGLGFANLFPLIFSITIDRMPSRTNELSGLMVTAIVGGAFIPPLMGYVQDLSTILTGFVVPLITLGYITFVALLNVRKQSV